MTDFPNRPDHPDFWLMAEALQDLDSAADDRVALERLIEPFVDMESLMYVAGQRAIMAQQKLNPLMARTHESDRMRLQAVFLNAFVVGALYQKYKTERTDG
jgi:hypothetical protein